MGAASSKNARKVLSDRRRRVFFPEKGNILGQRANRVWFTGKNQGGIKKMTATVQDIT